MLKSHTRTVVLMATKQVNGKGQNSTPSHAKTLNWSSPKLAYVITSGTAPGMQNFVSIGLGVSAPQIRDFDVLRGWQSFFSVSGVFSKATVYTPKRIFTQNTSKDVVPRKEVPFVGHYNYI